MKNLKTFSEILSLITWYWRAIIRVLNGFLFDFRNIQGNLFQSCASNFIIWDGSLELVAESLFALSESNKSYFFPFIQKMCFSCICGQRHSIAIFSIFYRNETKNQFKNCKKTHSNRLFEQKTEKLKKRISSW